VAYLGGYFEWPRTSTGQEIADRLGISPATLTQHLRTAERKFFDTVFDEGRAGEEADTSTWSSESDDA
jgi:predicted DNA binding protein